MSTPYERFARLFEYPDESYADNCRAAGLHEFAEAMAKLSTSQIQEAFIATFDWNPDTALDIGWHLYGEQYDRGEFLLRMRQEMRRYGVPESSELPDHLTHVLPVLARMEAAEAEEFARDLVAPAVAKLLQALEAKNSPFVPMVRALRDALPAAAAIPVRRIELPVLSGRD